MKHRFNASFKKQVGIGLGYLLLIIVLVVAIGAAAMKFSSDSTPSTSGQQAQLDAGTFANQIGAMRGSLTMLATSTTTSWSAFGVAATPRRMTLGTVSGTQVDFVPGLDTGRQVAVPPRGATAGAGGVLAWNYTAADVVGDPLYMYTDKADVSLNVCKQFNLSATGSDAVLVNDTLGGVTLGQTASTGSLTAYKMDAAFYTAVNGAGHDAGCYVTTGNAATGPGRIVARLR